MSRVGTQFEDGAPYDTFYLDHATPARFTVYQNKDGVKTPYDLSTFDQIKLMLYDGDDDTSLRESFSMGVLAAAGDLVSGVKARCEGTVVPGSAHGGAGRVRCKLVATVGGEKFLISKPWMATIFAGGPTT